MKERFKVLCEWNGRVDPYIAMMIYRKQDPMYSQLDFDSMMQLYSKMINHELRQKIRQQQEQQLMMHPSAGHDHSQFPRSNINVVLPRSPVPLEALRQANGNSQQTVVPSRVSNSRPNNKVVNNEHNGARTYAELQPVQSTSRFNDGTEVLRRHQESTKELIPANNPDLGQRSGPTKNKTEVTIVQCI